MRLIDQCVALIQKRCLEMPLEKDPVGHLVRNEEWWDAVLEQKHVQLNLTKYFRKTSKTSSHRTSN